MSMFGILMKFDTSFLSIADDCFDFDCYIDLASAVVVEHVEF